MPNYLEHKGLVIKIRDTIDKSNIPKTGIAWSHYIISKEIIADPIPPGCQCDWHAVDYRLLDCELESVNPKMGWYLTRSLYQSCALWSISRRGVCEYAFAKAAIKTSGSDSPAENLFEPFLAKAQGKTLILNVIYTMHNGSFSLSLSLVIFAGSRLLR